MEAEAHFVLENAIANWRAELNRQEGIGAADTREMEAHLREDVGNWVRKGLSEREAFQIAMGRLGSVEALAMEFRKENPLAVWRTRVFWIFVGVISIYFFNQIVGLVVQSGAIVSAKAWQATGNPALNPGSFSVASMAYAFLHLAMMVLSPLAIYFGSKWLMSRDQGGLKFSRFAKTRLSLALTLICAAIALGLLGSVAQFYFQKTLNPDASPLPWMTLSLVYGLMNQLNPILLAILIARLAPERLFLKRRTE